MFFFSDLLNYLKGIVYLELIVNVCYFEECNSI